MEIDSSDIKSLYLSEMAEKNLQNVSGFSGID
jgi:hypothetical protein